MTLRTRQRKILLLADCFLPCRQSPACTPFRWGDIHLRDSNLPGSGEIRNSLKGQAAITLLGVRGLQGMGAVLLDVKRACREGKFHPEAVGAFHDL